MKEREVFDFIFDIAVTLLKNGSEINRIEKTVKLLAEKFSIKDFDCFVMINGIFLTAKCGDNSVQARVTDVAISPINLGRIDAINTLSRKLIDETIKVEQAKYLLEIIKIRTYASNITKILGYAFGCASFGYVFGGSFNDCIGAFFIGIIVSLYHLYIIPLYSPSKVVFDISSSVLVGILACGLYTVFPFLSLSSLVTGGIISLVPGVAIVNGIRYLFEQDYNSGWSQMVNAAITSFCISIGVGTVLSLFKIM